MQVRKLDHIVSLVFGENTLCHSHKQSDVNIQQLFNIKADSAQVK